MKNKLYLMSGMPCSGKSTYAKGYLINEKTKYVSRDEIRFALLKEGDEYFSKENEVFNTFIDTIKNYLHEGYDVIADATHLHQWSRAKLLYSLAEDLKDTEVIAVFMRTPLNVCLERDKTRKGTKFYVPEKTLLDMAKSLRQPNFSECRRMINQIWIVDGENCIKKVRWED